MRKKFSIYHLLIAIMLFGLFTPAVSAGHKGHEPYPSDSPKGSLTIYKYKQEKDAAQGEGDGSEIDSEIVGELLGSVTFTLTQTHAYNQLTDKWTEVTGDPKKYVETTGADGKIHIPNIELGRYTVQETGGPPHVVLNNEVYSVDIPMTSKDGSEVKYDVYIYPKNEIIRGKVELKKLDGDTENLLTGEVTFDLFDSKGNKIYDDLATNNGIITVDGLAYGDYYFVETATVEGYLINGEPVHFSITEQGETATVSLANYKEPKVEKEVNEDAVNRGETVTYTITVDLPVDIANYDSFVITDVLHDNLEYVDGSQSGATGFTFNQDGQTLTWTADPKELAPGEVEITFEARISDNAEVNVGFDNIATIDYHNGYVSGGKTTPPVTVTPTAGSLKVIKVDGDNEDKLEGAVFQLRQGNELIATGTSGADGVVVFDNPVDELDYGNYQLVETKAPEGYNKLRNPINVTIDDQESVVELTVDNYKSGWELPKTGGIGTMAFTFVGFLLMGASLFLYIRRRRQEIIE